MKKHRPTLPREAYTINEFCQVHGLSRSQYFILRRQGRGPKEMRISDRAILISIEAAAEWRQRLTTASSAA